MCSMYKSFTFQAGGLAGTAVDVSIFPFDTVKTRLQSAEGFWRAGGFKGVYSGLASAALGSAPTGMQCHRFISFFLNVKVLY